MTVTLTVEDGTIVVDANTFASRDYAIAYAGNRGVTLEDTEETDIDLLVSMDYFRQYDQAWKGFLVAPLTQVLAWPRQAVILYTVSDYGFLDGSGNTLFNGSENILPFGVGSYLPATTIPTHIKDAQVQLTMAIKQGLVLLPNVGGGSLPIIKEVVGPLETDYAKPVDLAGFDWNSTRLPTVDALLAPLLSGARGRGLRSRRV